MTNMSRPKKSADPDLLQRLKLLMFFRVVFTSLLLGSTILIQSAERTSLLARPLVILYGLIVSVFVLSFIYGVLVRRVRNLPAFAFFQIAIDTVIVSLIIFVTGCFTSIFGFLYLVVIIYASLVMYGGGSLSMAAFCSLQLATMVLAEYYQLFEPLLTPGSPTAADFPGMYVLYKTMMMVLACFAVAYLSHLLTAQTRKTRTKLLALEDRFHRVEKLAAMGEMAAGLAHEIKNPLASIAGSIQLMREDMQSGRDQSKLMEIVLRETDRLSTLVTNFLLFARPPIGKSTAIKLDTALGEIVDLFKQQFQNGKPVEIVTELAPNIWTEMDPEHFKQVIWNLLLNAVDALDETGRVVVRLKSNRRDKVRITIADTGCGMTEDTLEAIFDPFFTTKSKGSGLGLSIVHSILESYDCWINVNSEKDLGTEFTIQLNRTAPPDQSAVAAGGRRLPKR
jgi:two-component system sensor histidine kinase HydH